MYNENGDYMSIFYLIEIYENQLNYLYSLKFELKNNKPFFFQRKRLKNYLEKLNYIDNQINEYSQKLISEYQKLEKK